MGDNIDVSVILSTYNRCDLLAGALKGLADQEAAQVTYEIIVVDNNSNDDTRKVVEQFAADDSRFRYFFEPRQGLSYGLNRGLVEARGGIVALTDDDLCVAADYVAQLATAFSEHPEIEFLGGKVVPLFDRHPPKWLTPLHWAPLALQDYGDEIFYVDRTKPLCLVNKSFRASVFREHGNFRPEMGRTPGRTGSAEDHELMIRIWLKGGRGAYIPKVKARAFVQSERLSKRYHRLWHFRHGRFLAQIADLKYDQATGSLLDRDVHPPTWFGSPTYVYGKLIGAAVGRIVSVWNGRADAFYFENRFCEKASFIITRFSSWLRS